MPGDWDDLIVICGTTFWSGTRLLDQHLAQELTAYAPVLYVDPPVSVLTRLRNRDAMASAHAPGLERIGQRLSLLSPRVPPLKERPVGKQVALALTRRAMRSAVRQLGSRSVRAVIVPSLNPLFGAVGGGTGCSTPETTTLQAPLSWGSVLAASRRVRLSSPVMPTSSWL